MMFSGMPLRPKPLEMEMSVWSLDAAVVAWEGLPNHNGLARFAVSEGILDGVAKLESGGMDSFGHGGYWCDGAEYGSGQGVFGW